MQLAEKEMRLNQLKLIIFIMLFVFLFMLVFTIYWMIDYKQKYDFFEKTEAVVVEHKVGEDSKIHDMIAYDVGGNEYRVLTNYETINDIGDKIDIYYDSSNPIGIVYQLDNKRIILPILTSIFGVAILGLSIIYLKELKSLKDTKARKGKLVIKAKKRINK